MPQYWLKPVGVTRPLAPVPNDFLKDADVDRLRIVSGPPLFRNPPQMGPGDRVLLHAVHHVRTFAEGEVLTHPEKARDPVWGWRWPWVYFCRIDVWVPYVLDGVRTTDVAPMKAMRRIQAGGEYASLSKEEYHHLVSALRGVPTAQLRESRRIP